MRTATRRDHNDPPHVELFAAGFLFPEGPTWHDDALWISDVAGGGVHRLDRSGTVTRVALDGKRGIGGLVATHDGRLLAAGANITDVLTGDVIVHRPPHATGFNDIAADGTGALLVGVLTFRPLAGEPPSPGAVARIDGAEIDWDWFTGPVWPNGLGLRTDGDLVVADYHSGCLWLVDPTGRPRRRVGRSTSGHYDGLCIDDDGGTWVATGPGGALEHHDRDGRLLTRLDLPASFVSSACFSGADPSTLFVTVAGCHLAAPAAGTGAVLTVSVATPGRPPAPAQIRSGHAI